MIQVKDPDEQSAWSYKYWLRQGLHDVLCQRVGEILPWLICWPLQVPWAKAVPLNISALQGTPLEAGDSLCYRGLILGWRGTQPSAPVYSFPFPSGNLGKIRSQFQSLKWRFLFHSSHTPVVTLAKSTQGEATSFIHICWVNAVVITKYFAFYSLIFLIQPFFHSHFSVLLLNLLSEGFIDSKFFPAFTLSCFSELASWIVNYRFIQGYPGKSLCNSVSPGLTSLMFLNF